MKVREKSIEEDVEFIPKKKGLTLIEKNSSSGEKKSFSFCTTKGDVSNR